MGASVSADSGWIFEHFALVSCFQTIFGGCVDGVANGEWWRLLTAAFLHHGPIHLALNMVALWLIGGPLEQMLGHGRYLMLYIVSGLAGSAGALLVEPRAITVGASGAIFGIIGALLVVEYQRTGTIVGPALSLLVVNLAFTFFIPGISIGGHLGGLVGGILGALALSRFGRGHVAYGRLGLLGIGSLVLIGVLSVAIAYLKVRGMA
jgi:membrane associated rhomboid family serine protease